MSRTISVVVPTYNSAAVIGQCLASLEHQSHPPDDVVVSDGGSTDETAAIANAHGAKVVLGAANRSAQRNAGAERALGEYVVFVDSDMQLTPAVLEDSLTTFRESDAALVIPEVFVGENYWARVRGFERSFYDDVWWLQAARCYRRAQFLEIGGFDAGLIGPEDWDLDERIRQFGEVRQISAIIEHDEGRPSFSRLLQKKAHYAGSFPEFRVRHPERSALCFSVARRAALFVRRPGRLLAHPTLAAGVATMGIAEIGAARDWLKFWTVPMVER
jgi:glycosyltransferase involved in cell wall biosynthesis